MLSIKFTIEENGYTFTDAIVLPDNHTLTKAQIESVKKQRFQAWLDVINTLQKEEIE